MARLFTSGFELGDLTNGVEWTVLASTPTIESAVKRTGSYSMKTGSLSSTTRQGHRYHFKSVNNDGPFYFRTYLRVDTYPSADNEIIQLLNSTPAQKAAVRLSSAGKLLLRGDGTAIGTGTTTLSLGQWYRIELFFDATPSAGNDVLTLRIDGVQELTSSAQTFASGIISFRIGGNLNGEAQTQGVWYWDDVAINDTTGSFQTSWPGAGSVIHLLPNAAGDNNAFATEVGGTAGPANNFTRVDEVTPDDATTSNADNTLNRIDDFNIETVPSDLGDTSTINVVQVGLRYAGASGLTDAGVKARIKKTTGGTVSLGSEIVPNSTSWLSNANTEPKIYPLVTYQDPDSANWSKATLNTAQVGYTVSTGGVTATAISKVWALVDYVPGADAPVATGNLTGIQTHNKSATRITDLTSAHGLVV